MIISHIIPVETSINQVLLPINFSEEFKQIITRESTMASQETTQDHVSESDQMTRSNSQCTVTTQQTGLPCTFLNNSHFLSVHSIHDISMFIFVDMNEHLSLYSFTFQNKLKMKKLFQLLNQLRNWESKCLSFILPSLCHIVLK